MSTPIHITPARLSGIRVNRRRGRMIVPLIILLLVIAIGGLFWMLTNWSHEQHECEQNLKSIYTALETYEAKNHMLPKLAYFPDDPNDADSLRTVLEGDLPDLKACICPGLHPMLREMGMTYIWNMRLNGKPLPQHDEQQQWMLVEMTAISRDVPSPHIGGYNVLYTDGSVKHVANPTAELLPGL